MTKRFYPWARYIKYNSLYFYALLHAAFFPESKISRCDTLFVIGCGRSGTTVLGEMLEAHPSVRYIFEPWHFWAAVDPRLDITQLFTKNYGPAIINDSYVSSTSKLKFERLFYGTFIRLFGGRPPSVLIEKTPHNAFRIGYLNGLNPNAYYLNIVRDGVAVVESIGQIAKNNSSIVAGLDNFNQWWGCNSGKWQAIKLSAVSLGFDPNEIEMLVTDRQKGACEWLLSLMEVEKYRSTLGGRLLDVRYEDLITHPRNVLEMIAEHFNFTKDVDWLERASNMIGVDKSAMNKEQKFAPLYLPVGICVEFNKYQRKFQFNNMAIPLN